MTDQLRRIVLVVATVDMGLFAGLFFAFSVAVMPGLARTSDTTFVDTMQRINVAILNPLFFLCYIGTPVLIIAALLLHFGHGLPVLLLIGAGLLLSLVVIGITAAGNIPLNNALDAVGPPGQSAHLAEARAMFERRWVQLNNVRTLISLAGLGCLSTALVISGR
jgi:uncharacterized membrane protein